MDPTATEQKQSTAFWQCYLKSTGFGRSQKEQVKLWQPGNVSAGFHLHHTSKSILFWMSCLYLHPFASSSSLLQLSVVAHQVALTTNASRAVGEQSSAWWDGAADVAALPYCCAGDRVDVRFPMGFVSGVKTCIT